MLYPVSLFQSHLRANLIVSLHNSVIHDGHVDQKGSWRDFVAYRLRDLFAAKKTESESESETGAAILIVLGGHGSRSNYRRNAPRMACPENCYFDSPNHGVLLNCTATL